MSILIILGTGLTCIGLIVLGYCISAAIRAKRANLTDEAMRARLQKIVNINMAALAIAVIGLMFVILGVSLG